MTVTHRAAEPDVPAHAGVAPPLLVLMCNRRGGGREEKNSQWTAGLKHGMRAA